MSIYKKRMNFLLGSIATSKALTISSVETIYTIGSGAIAVEISNQGVYDLYYGQSNNAATFGIVISSGNGAKFWDTISDNFTLALALNTAGVSNSSIIVHEYQGF